jgi:hypothetical protein
MLTASTLVHDTRQSKCGYAQNRKCWNAAADSSCSSTVASTSSSTRRVDRVAVEGIVDDENEWRRVRPLHMAGGKGFTAGLAVCILRGLILGMTTCSCSCGRASAWGIFRNSCMISLIDGWSPVSDTASRYTLPLRLCSPLPDSDTSSSSSCSLIESGRSCIP